jgi:hypothetical protein
MYVTTKNRDKMMKYVRNKQQDRHNSVVNLNNLDSQYDMGKYMKNGHIDEKKRDEAYVHYNKMVFDQMRSNNQQEIKNQFLSKVQDDLYLKKKKMLASRSQFDNYQSQISCLPKQSRKKAQLQMQAVFDPAKYKKLADHALTEAF